MYPTDPSDNRIRILGALLLLGALVCLLRVGSHALWDPDEGRYAEIPREMIESGDYITPHLNYVKYLEKPPLLYWAVAGSMKLFGQNERAARLVPATAALLTLMVVLGLGCRLLGGTGGILATWIYLTSLLPLGVSQALVTDGLLTLLLTATWAAWWLGYASPPGRARARWYLGSWACLALATLTKGPVAILLTGLIVFVFLALRRDLGAVRHLFWGWGVLAFAAIALPWHVLVSVRNPEFLHFYIVVQHLDRFLGITEEHGKPVWFFLPYVLLGMGGWAGVLLVALAAAWQYATRAVAAGSSGAQPSSEPLPAGTRPPVRPDGLLFLMVWAGVVVVFFSISRCKLIPYILPAFPALAVLLAWYLARHGASRAVRWAVAATGLFVILLGSLTPMLLSRQHEVPAEVVPPTAGALGAALLLAGVALLVAAWRRWLLPLAPGLVLLLAGPVLLAAVGRAGPYSTLGDLVRALPVPIPAKARVVEANEYDQSFSFYTRRRVVLVDAVTELGFGSQQGDNSQFFLQGFDSLKRMAREGPLLAAVKRKHWHRVRPRGLLRPVAANAKYVLAANDELLRLTGLQEWSEETLEAGPPLLLPALAPPRQGGPGPPALQAPSPADSQPDRPGPEGPAAR